MLLTLFFGFNSQIPNILMFIMPEIKALKGVDRSLEFANGL